MLDNVDFISWIYITRGSSKHESLTWLFMHHWGLKQICSF